MLMFFPTIATTDIPTYIRDPDKQGALLDKLTQVETTFTAGIYKELEKGADQKLWLSRDLSKMHSWVCNVLTCWMQHGEEAHLAGRCRHLNCSSRCFNTAIANIVEKALANHYRSCYYLPGMVTWDTSSHTGIWPHAITRNATIATRLFHNMVIDAFAQSIERSQQNAWFSPSYVYHISQLGERFLDDQLTTYISSMKKTSSESKLEKGVRSTCIRTIEYLVTSSTLKDRAGDQLLGALQAENDLQHAQELLRFFRSLEAKVTWFFPVRTSDAFKQAEQIVAQLEGSKKER